jgi:chemotaxis signal transduction protein
LRKRFGLPPKPIDLSSHLLIAETDGRVMALVVDVVSEVVSIPVDALDNPSEMDLESLQYLWAVGKLGDKLVLILDLGKTLTFEEQNRLERVLAQEQWRARGAESSPQVDTSGLAETEWSHGAKARSNPK